LIDIELLASRVVDCAYHLHRQVGPGLLESVYETVLAKRLADMGIEVERQKPIPIQIDGIAFGDPFRADLLIERQLIVEIKSAEKISPLHVKQVITYLRLTDQPLGLLINFGGETFKDNIKRVMNNHAA
jgi:GxxExxY protein